MLWEIDIYPSPERSDLAGQRIAAEAAELLSAGRRAGRAADAFDSSGSGAIAVSAARGYLLEGDLDESQVRRAADELLADAIVENAVVAAVGDARFRDPPEWRRPEGSASAAPRLISVVPKPGVTDPVSESAATALRDLGISVDAVRTLKKFWIWGVGEGELETLGRRLLSNASIEHVYFHPLEFSHLQLGAEAPFERLVVPLRSLDADALERLSVAGQLHLTLAEMATIQAKYQGLGRDPTDIELETLAQTWSEHCSHKTLAGRIAYRDDRGERLFENMLKETIFAATVEIREELQSRDQDWCVSVFQDNAGVVRFDDRNNVTFKVETHNHPSAIEPYGGANTGLGGVIRDTLGTGLGARPVCNTDVFCFAPPDTPQEALPPGTLHPRRVLQGVVAGVRDYGNRMGIPTVNGALCFDPRYLGNPLVFCGSVGLLPHSMTFKAPRDGDWIVSLGGRTGRDGIHGATFSSAPMTTETESISGGAVQIGNAITEKMLQDVLLEARDRELYTAVTDCGAGGFSSAVGEMGERLGAEVYLERAPLKYDGLTYTEIWISEAQERMVLAVPPERWEEFHELCGGEDVEATIIGKFVATGQLRLTYQGQEVGSLEMEFLHRGRPPVVREAVFEPPAPSEAAEAPPRTPAELQQALLDVLGSLNVCSKEWVIRQYDHEVQGGSVIKPLVGVQNDGPSDAAVVRPVLDSRRGLVVSCGINPHYGDLDPYWMAASAIDEAIRNCVAVGADPERIALLDNFCWGYTDRPETLGSLVRAALGCHDVAVAMGTPFISGKDSLNNEFGYEGADGAVVNIAIPPTLLISALGQVADSGRCVTMDFKSADSRIYLVGETRDELGGSHWNLVTGERGGSVPQLDAAQARTTYRQLHQAMAAGLVRACHDLSEGGLAVAAAEMAFAGGLGAVLQLDAMACDASLSDRARLFAESNSRLLCEVAASGAAEFETMMAGTGCREIGYVAADPRLVIRRSGDAAPLIDLALDEARRAWQAPLRMDDVNTSS